MGHDPSLKPLSSPPKDEADSQTSEELKIYRDRESLVNVQLLQDIEERKKYAKRIFYTIGAWLMAVLLVVVFKGFTLFGFDVSDKVLITLISSTTINVLGLFFVVIRYLFQRNPTRSTL